VLSVGYWRPGKSQDQRRSLGATFSETKGERLNFCWTFVQRCCSVSDAHD